MRLALLAIGFAVGFATMPVYRRMIPPPPSASLYDALDEQQKSLSIPPRSVVFVGDSLVYYGDWSLLLNRPIINRGLPGDTSAKLLQRIDTIAAINPSVVVIAVGINDMLDGGDVVTNIKAAIGKLKDSDTEVYVCTLALPEAQKHRKPQVISDINTKLLKLPNCIDCTELDNPGLRFDGLHYNANGYLVWARLLKKKLDKVSDRP